MDGGVEIETSMTRRFADAPTYNMFDEQEEPMSKTASAMLAAVLEDCVSQLAVLGAIAPVSKESSHQTKVDVVGEVVQESRQYEREYDRLLAERQELHHSRASEAALQENEAAVRNIAAQLKRSTQILVKNLRANPGEVENSIRIQGERQKIQDLLEKSRSELICSNTCSTLVSGVHAEVQQQQDIINTIKSAGNSRQTAANLLVELEEVGLTMQEEIKELDEELAQLKDQLQETKSRVALEGNYIKKEASVRVAVDTKVNGLKLAELRRKIDEIRSLEAEEQKCSAELMSFLRDNYEDLKQKQGDWMNKFEKDVEAKQLELDNLKRDRAQDLQALREMTELYNDYEQVCQDDRQAREDARIAAQLAVIKLAAAIKIQAWWRGMIVRGKVGAKKGKKGKGKKKSGKKKKKK